MEGTIKTPANFVPLSPISFLERAAAMYADETSIVYGSVKFSWKQTFDRCNRLASALSSLAISTNDVVAALAPNIPALYELHFGVPMIGALLCALNTRFDAAMISALLQHSEAKVLLVDYQFLDVATEALKLLSSQSTTTNIVSPKLVLIRELDRSISSSSSSSSSDVLPGELEYESLIESADTTMFKIKWPEDECQPISLSYTSGTTSVIPKGVIYSHRGAYLNAVSCALLMELGSMPVFLWTVPMFHANGWCFTWAIAAQGGMNICLRDVSERVIFDNIATYKVTHMGGAPTLLNMIINSSAEDQKLPLPGEVSVIVGGAPPPPKVLFKMEEFGFHVVHAYGMTETYGAATACARRRHWNSMDAEERADIKSRRQGIQLHAMAEVDIKNPNTMESVPADGVTVGEVMFRGNTVMNGYFKNLTETQKAFHGGWYRTGDLGVRHTDGEIEMKDRSKDIIVTSGGEVDKIISTIEVESVICSHPSVLEAAVVGRPDEICGESPCAFVKLKEEHGHVEPEEMIEFCRARLPHDYMAPTTVVFVDNLPKTSTGKTQKFVLRDRVQELI